MNIGSLNSAIAARTPVTSTAVSDVSDIDGVDAPPPPPEDASSRVSLSKGSELMQQLSDLQKSDPAKFKLVVDQISQKFGQLASSKTGAEGEGFSRLSEAFKKVADTGDLTALRPEGHRGHRASGAQGGEGVGQGARAAETYRKNGPSAPRAAIEDAFTQALAIVDAAETQQTPTDDATSGVTTTPIALSNLQTA